MSRESRYSDQTFDYDDVAIFSRKRNSMPRRKTWHIAKYIRLSREDGDDKDESNSITSQNKILDDLIQDLEKNSDDEYVVYDTYSDDGYSGTDFARPDFQRLLRDMKER